MRTASRNTTIVAKEGGIVRLVMPGFRPDEPTADFCPLRLESGSLSCCCNVQSDGTLFVQRFLVSSSEVGWGYRVEFCGDSGRRSR